MSVRGRPLLLRHPCVAAGILLATAPALGQETRVPEGAPWPDDARVGVVLRGGPPVFNPSTNGLPNILLTGYWPPTNEMLRPFSPNPSQNLGEWVGENWEGRGYNVYAYFPEFPDGLGKGEGDFEVDYQDTSHDWWPLLDAVSPIALITFSRAGNDHGWEMEGGNRTYALNLWTNDYLDPRKPTPELPIADETPGNERFSSLPIADIIHDVSTSGVPVNPFSTVIDNGRFLSNYIGYHGNWHHDLHSDPIDPQWNIAGGHIHVGYAMSVATAEAATMITVRTLIAHVDARRALVAVGDLNGDGAIDDADYAHLADCMNGPEVGVAPAGCDPARFVVADLDGDSDVDLADGALLSLNFGAVP